MPDGGHNLAGGPTRPGQSAPTRSTFARLCAVPLAVFLVLHAAYMPAFWLFLAAGASDAVDGWLARRRGPSNRRRLARSDRRQGPAGDHVRGLAVEGVLPDWLAILVVFRDVVIVGWPMLKLILMSHRPGDPPRPRCPS